MLLVVNQGLLIVLTGQGFRLQPWGRGFSGAFVASNSTSRKWCFFLHFSTIRWTNKRSANFFDSFESVNRAAALNDPGVEDAVDAAPGDVLPA